MAKCQPNQEVPPQPPRLDSHSTPAERKAANDNHHQTLIGYTLDAASYGGHGHATGRQGKRGHTMAPSGDKGKHAYIPQGVLGAPQNRQSTYSDGAGSASGNDASTSDYATVDKE